MRPSLPLLRHRMNKVVPWQGRANRRAMDGQPKGTKCYGKCIGCRLTIRCDAVMNRPITTAGDGYGGGAWEPRGGDGDYGSRTTDIRQQQQQCRRRCCDLLRGPQRVMAGRLQLPLGPVSRGRIAQVDRRTDNRKPVCSSQVCDADGRCSTKQRRKTRQRAIKRKATWLRYFRREKDWIS